MDTEDLRFKAIVPAAGLSSRMGAFKPLLPYGDSTVIECAVQSALSCADEVIVVLGKRAEEVEKALRHFGDRVITVRNPQYDVSDMLRSVQIGLAEIAERGECDGFFLLPGDMPAIAPMTFKVLCGAFDSQRRVIYPIIGGRRGHPPLLHASLIPEILAYVGDGGLREILRRYPAYEVAVSDSGILIDLDTPKDYVGTVEKKATKRKKDLS